MKAERKTTLRKEEKNNWDLSLLQKTLMTWKMLASIDEVFSLCVHMCMCNICTSVFEGQKGYWIPSSIAL